MGYSTERNKEMKSRVFVINEPNFRDMSSAKEFGELVTVLQTVDAPSHSPMDCTAKIAEALADFDEDRDYIVWAGGDPAGLLLVGIIMGRYEIQEFNFLRWERDRDPNGGRSNSSGRYENTRVRVPTL